MSGSIYSFWACQLLLSVAFGPEFRDQSYTATPQADAMIGGATVLILGLHHESPVFCDVVSVAESRKTYEAPPVRVSGLTTRLGLPSVGSGSIEGREENARS